MKIDDVPQDNVKTFQGYGGKAIYAVDEKGQYNKVSYNGWHVEETVLRSVIEDLAEQAAQAKDEALKGESSPIAYFMFRKLMDLPALAYGIGISRWRVKRHMKPKVFNRLPDHVLQKYADFFQIDLDRLKRFRENIEIDQKD